MDTNQDNPEVDLKEQARELRRQGLSIAEIADALGRRAHSPVGRWVAGVPVPSWTRRPNAKDDERRRARELRQQGWSLKQIAREVGVATSSVSVWVRDLPVPEGLRERASHAHRINSERWLRERGARAAERYRVKAAARARIGEVSDRELMLMGAVLYWAEGAKDKPHRRHEFVSLINSDPEVITMFLRWLDLMQVPEEHRRYRLSIHESADLAAAHAWWSVVIGEPVSVVARPTLKRHNPVTVRKNTGDTYHGYLMVSVVKSRELYQTIDGLFYGFVAGVDGMPRGGLDRPLA